MKKLVIRMIEHYQRRGGGKDLLGIDCLFHPTCSQYMKESIEKYGLLRGLSRGVLRLCRCRPCDSAEVRDDPVV